MLEDISTGASNDIQRASKIAREMVTKYGMSDKIGPISFGSENDEVFIGRDFVQSKNTSESVAAEIDSEVRSIIEGCYEQCIKLLEDNIDKLHAVAKVLLEKEKITGEEFETVFNGGTLPSLDGETPKVEKVAEVENASASDVEEKNVEIKAEIKPEEITTDTDNTAEEKTQE